MHVPGNDTLNARVEIDGRRTSLYPHRQLSLPRRRARQHQVGDVLRT
jgi:hypothetical protein